MISFGLVSGDFVAPGSALVGASICALLSLFWTALYVRNSVLNAAVAEYSRHQAIRGKVRLPVVRDQCRREALGVKSLSQRQLWKFLRADWTRRRLWRITPQVDTEG